MELGLDGMAEIGRVALKANGNKYIKYAIKTI